jgi:oligosaccharide repeat unit polymerase
LIFGCLLYFGGWIGVFISERSNIYLKGNKAQEFFLSLRYGKQIIIILVMIGLLSSILLIQNAGYTVVTLITNPLTALEIGRAYSGLRYAEGQGPPRLVVFLNVSLYVGQLFAGGWFASHLTYKKKIYAVLPLAVGLIQSFLINARSGFIWMFTLFIGSYLSAIIFENRHRKFINLKRIIIMSIIAVFFVSFYFLIQVIRENNADAIRTSIEKSRVSMLTSPILFSQWLEDNYYKLDFAGGTKSFSGLTDLLGFSETDQGLGWQGTTVQTKIGELTPNVYTAFRQIVEDFTIIGSMFFFLLLGVLSGMAYKKVERGNAKWYPILTLFYSITLSSYIANWMAYTSLIVAWFFFMFLLISPLGRSLFRRYTASDRLSS